MGMDDQFPFTFITSLLFVYFIFLLVREWRKPKSLKKLKKLPPSPWKLPLIGHLHHLVGGMPHQVLKKLSQKYGPIMHLQLGEVSSIVVSSRELSKDVLKTRDPACADRPQSIGTQIMWYDYVDIAFSPYNEYWRQMRKICIVEVLSAKNVRSFSSIRQDEASRLVKTLQASSGEIVNLTDLLYEFTSSITSRAAFGKIVRDRDTLVGLLRKGAILTGGFLLADLFPTSKLLHLLSWNKHKLLRMRRKLDAITDAIVDEHKANRGTSKGGKSSEFGGEDVVDVLLRLKESEALDFPITDNNIKAIIFDLFSAGTETASTSVNWAMAELMRNPDTMAKAQAEIRETLKGKRTIEESDIQKLEYLKLVIKETFRLHPPVPLLPRACREEIEVDGYTIPLKSKVMINIWGMGRDPSYWDEPESFKPERFENSAIDFLGSNFEYLPFGAGKRICPGMNFGLINVELPLAQLLYHFDWKLPKGKSIADIDMTETDGGAVVASKNSLLLVPTCYTPPSDGSSVIL